MMSALEQRQISLSELEKDRPCFKAVPISTQVVEAAHESLKNNSNWQSI